MATVPEPDQSPTPLYTPVYADVRGFTHDTPEMASHSSYHFLLAQEIGEVYGLPADPRLDNDRAGVAWFASNFETAIHALGLAAAQLADRGIEAPPPIERDEEGDLSDDAETR